MQKEIEMAKLTENCQNCLHRRGPIVLACGNSASEFFNGPVRPLGYCAGYARDPEGRRPSNAKTGE